MVSRRRFLSASLLAALSGCQGVPPCRPDGCPSPTGRAGDYRLGFVGDVMLGRGVNDYRSDRPPGSVWGDLLPRLDALDALVGNLECCLSDRGDPWPGRTYHFRADPGWAVPALSRAGTTWVSLANNHVLDYGEAAFRDTLGHLDGGGIAHAGAGPDLRAAIEPSVVTVGDLDIAFVAFTDRSPGYAAGPYRPGTAFVSMGRRNPRTRRLVRDAIARAREADPDLLVASLHWGPNWVTKPGARYRGFARWLIDGGVDLVHGHSAHVVQGVEVHRGRPIIHDAGDFVDDYAVKPDLHNDRSFLFEAAVADGRFDSLRLVPVEIENRAVGRADGAAAAWLRERMRTLSRAFGTAFRRDGEALVLDLC